MSSVLQRHVQFSRRVQSLLFIRRRECLPCIRETNWNFWSPQHIRLFHSNLILSWSWWTDCSSLSLSSVHMFVKWLWAYPTVKSQHMTKCPSPSSRTACLISSLLSNYSYVDYNKRSISFATNEKVDALSQIVNNLNSVAEWCCSFSSGDCKLTLKIPIWNMLINVLYCVVLYSCQ